MKRWLQRIAIALIAAFVAVYAGDLLIYKLRGSPSALVTVSQFQTVPLKGNKVEYDYIGTASVACSVSIFPQAGMTACWRLRRNPNQTTDL